MTLNDEKSDAHPVAEKHVEDAIVVGTSQLEVDPEDAARKKALTRKILWKTDLRILPLLIILYLCCWIDRANVGNAKILGLPESLHINSHQYGIALAVFYVFYIISEVPSVLLLKIVTPRRWLAALGIACGILGMCLAFVQNLAGFIVLRIILGLFEGGLLPGIVVYLSGLYTRGELALRIGIFYTSATLAGAFSGLLARGLSAIRPRGGIDAGWRWIMLIEGLLTMVVCVVVVTLLPNTISAARFLTPEEREYAATRLHVDATAHVEGGREVEAEKFSWSEVRRGLLNLQAWLAALTYITMLSGIYSISIFLPSIIKGLGYTANSAQLWSVIPYAVATVFTIAVAVLSDRYQLRGPFMLITLPVAIVGYAVIANVDDSKVHVKFAMTCLIASGLYGSAPPCIVWVTNNCSGHYKRAASSGLQLAVANCGGFIGSFIYPAEQGPRYFESHTIIMSLLILGCVIVNILYCAKINRDKANGKYDQFIGYGDDRDPQYKMTI
ncbi:hypothetical protein LTS17_003222 [Exophiala oligosperma]